ncbi:hypothetical protein R9X47_21790 [Wukongibacter baidiensis]|uniref:hypothetical protein n=1 Tax=Wukongibacter baidiensis TaxID=1723361 RepID=UPI003D7F59C4
MNFDESKAMLKKKSLFKSFNVKSFVNVEELLKAREIDKNDGILIFKMKDKYYGFKTIQMHYHHIAQGRIENEPFMVSF